jgi:hypothetical protein
LSDPLEGLREDGASQAPEQHEDKNDDHDDADDTDTSVPVAALLNPGSLYCRWRH